MPSSWQKVVYTPPICITIRLPFVSRYFCRSIRVRGRWNTPNYWSSKTSSRYFWYFRCCVAPPSVLNLRSSVLAISINGFPPCSHGLSVNFSRLRSLSVIFKHLAWHAFSMFSKQCCDRGGDHNCNGENSDRAIGKKHVNHEPHTENINIKFLVRWPWDEPGFVLILHSGIPVCQFVPGQTQFLGRRAAEKVDVFFYVPFSLVRIGCFVVQGGVGWAQVCTAK